MPTTWFNTLVDVGPIEDDDVDFEPFQGFHAVLSGRADGHCEWIMSHEVASLDEAVHEALAVVRRAGYDVLGLRVMTTETFDTAYASGLA